MFFYLVTPLILITASSLGLLISPSWSLSPFVWVFILVPIIDIMLPYLNKKDEQLNKASKNLKECNVLTVNSINPSMLINADKVVVTSETISSLTEVLS